MKDDKAIDFILNDTDMAIGSLPKELSGKGIEIQTKKLSAYKKTIINIKTQEASERMSKPIGKYITIQTEDNKYFGPWDNELLIKILTNTINEYNIPNIGKNILLIGLGNKDVPADSFGTKTLDNIISTRTQKMKNLRQVALFVPGVERVTGIHTLSHIKLIIENIKPDMIIIIDSLKANNMSSLGNSIQFSNGGIRPGGGYGQQKTALNTQTLGVKTLAIGLPTVVSLNSLTHSDKFKDNNTIVTTKDILQIVSHTAHLMGRAFNNIFLSPSKS